MGDKAIFEGDEGRQLKFFIQKDLDATVIKDLHDKIKANGGLVETKMPIQGYVLIEPKSSEGTRLIDCWSTVHRPFRYFVPHTFVEASLQAGKALPQVFRKDAEPIAMHIHSSITNEKTIETLTGRIWHSGGDPTAAEAEAGVIIADESVPIFRALVERFDHCRNKYVEPIPWVKRCVERGVYENTPVVKKNLGGRIAGNKRTEFTHTDDINLVNYIASRLPDPTMRGRTGNKLYQDLCSRLDLYPWATRHPWQSWRERYKNNFQRFNLLITEYIKQNPVPEDGKGLHGFVRAPTGTPVKGRVKKTASEFSDNQTTGLSQPLAEREIDPDWGSQWNVRVGVTSPPPWGKEKRKAADTQESPDVPNKRLRSFAESEASTQVKGEIGPAANNLRVGGTRLLDTVPAEGTSQQSPPTINVPEPENVLEYPESSGVSPGDAISHTSRTRSRSPGESSGVVSALPDLSAMDPESDGEGLGSETQVFLAAHRVMLSGPSVPRPLASPLSGEIQKRVEEKTEPSAVLQQLRGECEHAKSDVEHHLSRIACECRFLLEEVKEEYEELDCDLEATRLHFQEMRAIIAVRKKMRKAPSGSH